MSTVLPKNFASKPRANLPENGNREPQQERSKASLERMLGAARELMLERGSEDFTLQEVGKRGNVSIGSIYLRFESKDSLVRAVLADALTSIEDQVAAMLAQVRSASSSLDELLRNYVDAYAGFLEANASLLRLAMERAAHDPSVSGPGKVSARRSAEAGMQAMLTFAGEIGGTDPAAKCRTAYHVIFATLARHLSLGSSAEAAEGMDFPALKRELGTMCSAYLKAA